MHRIISFSVVVPLLLALLGCTTSPITKLTSDFRSALPNGQGWWYARFLLPYPEDSKPNWALGTLIGGEVIIPLLDQYGQDISLWRVHRRAAHDGGGHAFSFIFYTTAPVAQQVYDSIKTNSTVAYLKTTSVLNQVNYDDTSHINKPNIEDTSDPEWPASIQKSWPNYAMGVSRMWLDLVNDTKNKQINYDNLEDRYQIIHNELTEIWEQEGQHALLHHLNAIFAYQPLLIRY